MVKCGYIYVHLHWRAGLTCPERGGGEGGFAYLKAGSRKEIIWDTNMSDVLGKRGYIYVHLHWRAVYHVLRAMGERKRLLIERLGVEEKGSGILVRFMVPLCQGNGNGERIFTLE